VEEIIDLDNVKDKYNKFYCTAQYRPSFTSIFSFSWNRFRAVLQDISLLQGFGEKVLHTYEIITSLEMIIRFCMLSYNEGRISSENKQSEIKGDFEHYDEKLNTNLITDAMSLLREAYKLASMHAKFFISMQPKETNAESIIRAVKEQSNNFYLSPNQPEFYAYELVISAHEPLELAQILRRLVVQ
jgi:hypothetical protein